MKTLIFTLTVLITCLIMPNYHAIAYAEDMATPDAESATNTINPVDLFAFAFDPGISILYQPLDGSIDYGLGVKFCYLYNRTFYVGIILVPGENIGTESGEGKKALWGPDIGVDVLKAAQLAGIEIELPIQNLEIGIAWLINSEEGLKPEKCPRIKLAYYF